MNIRLTSLVISSVLAFSFITVISYILVDLYQLKQDSIKTQSSIEATSILNKAIIELSLERSVMQVTLNLDDPIAAQFKELLDGQRAKSDQGFQKVIELVTGDMGFRRANEFLSTMDQLRDEINIIRTRADQNLRVSSAQRTKSDIESLPPEMKNTILSFSKLPLQLSAESAQIPAAVATLQKVQNSAWAIREYGGRERTYLAIATATGRPFTEELHKQMKSYHQRAIEAMSELSLTSGYVGLEQDILDGITNIDKTYFGSYKTTREAVFSASYQGEAYPISFGDFFTQSTEALDTAVNLSYLAGSQMVTFMEEQRRESVILFRIFSIALGLVILFCAFQMYYSHFKVSGRIRSLSLFMNELSNGNTDVDLTKLQSSDEIGQMATHVEVFRKNAIEVKQFECAKIEQQKAAEMAKKQSAVEMANSFEQRIGAIVESVETASENMTFSIEDISSDIRDTCQQAKQCSSSAESSQEKLSRLQHAVEEVHGVIEAINDVAAKTNILSLNASIEAARAGEAGKGFAVVANGVQSLAKETHRMTEEISTKLQDMKESSSQTIDTVSDIISQISVVHEKTSNVAFAIEGQNGFAAASSAQNSFENENLKYSANDLRNESKNLKTAVDGFLNEIRSS